MEVFDVSVWSHKPFKQKQHHIILKYSFFCPQVVFAEAHAAGLFKGGIRRAAFSMGDLQALQPPEPPSLPARSPSQRYEEDVQNYCLEVR